MASSSDTPERLQSHNGDSSSHETPAKSSPAQTQQEEKKADKWARAKKAWAKTGLDPTTMKIMAKYDHYRTRS